MSLAIMLAKENVKHGTGGPFGAAVFNLSSGSLVSVGMNLVVLHNNATLHAEMVALMMAGQRLSSFTLNASGMPPHEISSSCDPCAMCLGAVLWSGAKQLSCGATREDATKLGFDEGPVFSSSYDYLEERGIKIRRGILRDRAADVMKSYRSTGGRIYNG